MGARQNSLARTLAPPVDRKPELVCDQSGWRDSNPRPPAPKAGALTKLRYIPST
jgi:hypothetical protein